MAVKQREYLLSTNKFKEPAVLTGKSAIGMLLIRLMMMEPGTDPLHPGMGVGITKFRFGMDNHEELRKRIESQIETYLPYFANAEISLTYTAEHTLNVEITIDDVVYVYETERSNNLSSNLSEIKTS